LVRKGFLPSREISGARAPADPNDPTPGDGEALVLGCFFERGLGLPVHGFVRGLLYSYQIQLHHLNPTGILHIAFFITLCEAFLGIDPYWDLWLHFFRLTSVKDRGGSGVAPVGGASFQLKHSCRQEYFKIPFRDSNKGWHGDWFFVTNLEGSLPAFSSDPPRRAPQVGLGSRQAHGNAEEHPGSPRRPEAARPPGDACAGGAHEAACASPEGARAPHVGVLGSDGPDEGVAGRPVGGRGGGEGKGRHRR
jgi:Putative gypsy type transposon